MQIFALLAQYTCSHTVHMLTQQYLPPLLSTVKLSLFTQGIPVHSPWLPGYINIVQTVLIILMMAGLFPDWLVYQGEQL